MFEGVILISLGGNWGNFIDYSPLKEINLKDYHSFSSSLKHLNSMLCNFDSLFNALLEIDGDIYSKKPKVKFYEILPKQSIPKREKVMIRGLVKKLSELHNDNSFLSGKLSSALVS